jgi:biopolymer transport protein ExbD
MSMAVGGGKKGAAIADINVTPMADIMIVLLIIFMVITPMLQKGVDVKLPIATNTKERKDEAKTIRVAIRKDGQVYLNDIPQKDPNELTPQIKERLEDLPEGQRTVYLKADTDLDYGAVMKVMDLIREAGVEDLALIAESRVQGQGS